MVNKRIALLFFGLMFVVAAIAQTPESLMAEGKKMEQRYKDEDALLQYQQALRIAPKNQQVVIRCADVMYAMALHEADMIKQLEVLEQAKKYADAAYALDTLNAEANAMLALIYSDIAKRTKSKPAIANAIQMMKWHADKALAVAPDDALALHVSGKWHLEVLQLNGVKKAAISLAYGGGIKEANIKEAIALMELSKKHAPYYTYNYYDLANAYTFDKQYEKAVDLLQQLQKLPAKRQLDKDIKTWGAAALQKLQ